MIRRGATMFSLLASVAGAAHAQVLVAAQEPYQDWLEAACVMQPWSGDRVRALVEDRAEWIPRLQDWGFTAVIFIPGPGDIEPDYPAEALRAAIDDYHAAGMKVLMYWSIMHVGHHETWHIVADEHPEWWQRDAQGGTVTVYGDKWLCPNTGALDYTIDLGIELARALNVDGIMLDNNEFYYTDVGPTCYCEGCQAAFRAYIRAKLGDETLRAMGLDPETVRCPLPDEPLWPHWIDWRYIVWRDATAQFRQRLRAAMPGTVLCANTQYKHNWVLAVQEQIEAEDLLFSESRHQLGREMSCKLAYGHCLADGKPVWNYLGTWRDEDMSSLLAPAEILDQLCTSLAWNTGPWIVGYGLVVREPVAEWAFAQYVSEGDIRQGRDAAGGIDGSAAVTLAADAPARISVFQQPFLEVEGGERFSFSARYRTERVEGGRPRARLTFVNRQHRPPAGEPYVFYAEGTGGTHGWEEMTAAEVVAPEGAELLNVELFLWEASGQVWFDDVQLLRDGVNLVRNAGFEQELSPANEAGRDALAGGLRFLREHADLYRGATRWADVGLLLSRHSVDFAHAYNRFPRPTLHALMDAHIPFALFEEHQLDAEHLGRIRVLVVPQGSCLADEHIEALAGWVRAGGRLIFTGTTATMTEYAVARETDLLAELLGRPRTEMTEPVAVGEGIAQWLPQGDANAEVAPGLIEAIRAMGGGGIVRVDRAPKSIDLVAWAQPERRRLLLHLDRHEAGEPGEVVMRVAIPPGWDDAPRVTVHDLHAGTRELTAICTAGEVAFSFPAPAWYGVVVLQF
ncbi:MAG: hypothetical protein AB7Y46_04815 [Armatimonadota bacterium]